MSKEFILDKDRIGSAKSSAVEALEKTDPEFAKAFAGLSPRARAIGKLQGKLFGATGLVEINEVFAWFDLEYKDEPWYERPTMLDRVQILANCLPLVASDHEKAYRAAVKIWAACKD